MSMIIIGYTPLFCSQFGINSVDPRSVESFLKEWHEFNSPSPTGILWLKNDDKVNAIFIVEKAKAVYNHLIYWCQGDYANWFVYLYKQFEDGYCIAIHPNIRKSIERMKSNASAAYGHMFDKEMKDKFTVIYRPLICIGTSLKTINDIPGFDKTKLTVGLIDLLDCQAQNFDNVYMLSDVKYDEEYMSYVDNEIKDYKEYHKS